jgi:hypothetical protein
VPLDPTAPIVIDGAQPSTAVRAEQARQGRPVLLAFSRGKDSLAAPLALRDTGVEVRPFHLYLIPDLCSSMRAWPSTSGLGARDSAVPRPSLYRWLTR